MPHVDGKRVLVTGAGGFLGSAVVSAALRAGARVHALHRRKSDIETHAGAFGPGSRADGVKLHSAGESPKYWADLTDRTAVLRILREVSPDIILHCAGYANAARSLPHVEPALHDNVVATVNVLSAASEVGSTRVVLCGSIESPFPHGDLPIPNSPYAASKLAESIYAGMFNQLYGLNVCTARLAIVYGPGDARPGKLIPSVAMSLLRGEPALLTSGRRRVDWLYIDDAADALVACAARNDLAGETIDIGTGRLTSVAELVAILARHVGRPDLLRLGALPDRPDELEVVVNAEFTQARLGWRSAVTLEEGLAHTADWFAGYLAAPPPATQVIRV